MPTVKDWEEYVEMEEQYDIKESRKKVLHKQKTRTKKEWDNLENKLNRKGYKKDGKQRDKKNSWSNNSKRI